MSVFNLMVRNVKAAGKVLTKVRRVAILTPFLASCCAVLMCAPMMCAPSRDRFNFSDTRENQIDISETIGTDTESSYVSLFGADDQSADITVRPSEPGQLTIFNEPDLVLHLRKASGNHYTMRLGCKGIPPKLLGACVLICFACVDSDTIANALAHLNVSPTIQKFTRKFYEAMIASQYFNPTDRHEFYQMATIRYSDPFAQMLFYEDLCVFKNKISLREVVPMYINDVLIKLVEIDDLHNAHRKHFDKDLLKLNEWLRRYGTQDSANDRSIGEICTCLGQDIIDTLGDIQNMETPMYTSKLIKREKRRDWMLIREVSLHTKVLTYHRVPVNYGLWHSTGKLVSFGFQTIAEITKCILSQNIAKTTNTMTSAKMHRRYCSAPDRLQFT